MKKFIPVIMLSMICAVGAFSGAKSEAPAAPKEKEPLVSYVVRHGQTIFNLMDRVQGISDGVLTEKGIVGAVNMGKGLRDVKFENIYSSDLKRAIETARLAMDQNRVTKDWTVKEMTELREVSFGIYEGDPNYMMYAAMAKDLGLTVDPNAKESGAFFGPLVQYYKGDFMAMLEGLADFNKRVDTTYRISEDAAEVYARLQKGMDAIVAENPNGGNVMLVAHGQSISFLLSQIRVEVPAGAGLGNSSVTKIVYDFATKTYTLDGPVGDMSYAEAGAKL
jgi:probable phosphoglycerate mutase